MNTRRVNTFACPQAGRIGNNVRELARPVHVAENNKVYPSCATWKSFLTYFRHAISSFPGGARDKFDPGLFPAYALHCRCSINCVRTFVSATFQREPVEPYFNMAFLRDARGQIWSETTFWYVECLPCTGSTIEHLELSSGLRPLILASTSSIQLLSLEVNFMYLGKCLIKRWIIHNYYTL